MKRVIALVLAAVSLALLPACGGGGGAGPQKQVKIYYSVYGREQAEKGLVDYEMVSVQDDDAIVEHVLDVMFLDPVSEGLTSPYPKGSYVSESSLKDGRLSIYMSSPYSELSGLAETLADYCMVLTLCDLEGVNSVSIYVENGGKKLSLKPEDVIIGEI